MILRTYTHENTDSPRKIHYKTKENTTTDATMRKTTTFETPEFPAGCDVPGRLLCLTVEGFAPAAVVGNLVPRLTSMPVFLVDAVEEIKTR